MNQLKNNIRNSVLAAVAAVSFTSLPGCFIADALEQIIEDPPGSGTSAASGCHEAAELSCEKTAVCQSDASFTDEAACVEYSVELSGCSQMSNSSACAPGQTYQPDMMDACLDELAAASCSEFLNDQPHDYASSCARLCR